MKTIDDVMEFLDRLSDEANWSSGYPSAPKICDDMRVKQGCFTADIAKTAKKAANILEEWSQ